METLVLAEQQSDAGPMTVEAISPSPNKVISTEAFSRTARSITWAGISIEAITPPEEASQ